MSAVRRFIDDTRFDDSRINRNTVNGKLTYQTIEIIAIIKAASETAAIGAMIRARQQHLLILQ